MFNQFELVRESPSENKVVLAVLIVTADFINNQTLKVLVYGNTTDKTVNLRAFRVEVYFTLFIEDSLLSVRAKIEELIFINEELWRPRRRHIKNIFLFLVPSFSSVSSSSW